MSRWKAAGIHLALSAAIAAVLVFAMFALWYPPPYFALMGGAMLVFLIAGCDVVLGPIITLIIFKAGKKGLKLDLAIIAIVQVLALSYGVYMMFESRPVFTVFAVDRFEVVSPTDIKPQNLAEGSAPGFTSFPLTGPRVVGANLPTDPKLREDVLFNRMGGDLKSLPRFYVPYETIAREAARRAKPIAELLSKNPDARDAISKAVGKLARPPEKLGYLPLAGRFVDMAMIVDSTTGQMLTIVDANPW